MQIAFSKAFKRTFRKTVKRQRDLEDRFWSRVDIFREDPYHPSLRTHKLTGQLDGLWSFSVTYDVRVIFRLVDGDKAIFVDIGDHDTVY